VPLWAPCSDWAWLAQLERLGGQLAVQRIDLPMQGRNTVLVARR
jgi:hypothetical protein